jgi:hypothetical protein
VAPLVFYDLLRARNSRELEILEKFETVLSAKLATLLDIEQTEGMS